MLYYHNLQEIIRKIMRKYEDTHPWINFTLDMTRAPYDLWMLLGEIRSKCEHIAGEPLTPEIAHHLNSLYLAKGTAATAAIEGNTLSEEDVLKRIEGDLDLPPSKEYLGVEVDNIVAAYNAIRQRILSGGSDQISAEILKEYNSLVLKDLPLEEKVVPGELRTHSVAVGNYLGAPAEDCDYLLERLCNWLNTDFDDTSLPPMVSGTLKAIVSHVYIAWIHPFGDGNGRTARLVELQILLSSGVPAPSAQLLSNHYNQTRSEYYRQLDSAHRSGGDVMPFIKYAVQGFIDGLTEELGLIKKQQLEIYWTNYIYEQFRDKTGITATRRRRLALDLSEKDEAVPVHEVRYVSSRIAEAYAGKTEKTVHNDIDALVRMKIFYKTPKGVTANRELMLSFLPPVKNNNSQ